MLLLEAICKDMKTCMTTLKETDCGIIASHLKSVWIMADKGGIVMEKEIEDSELILYKTAGISYTFKEKDDALLIINRVSTISNDDIALESDLEKLTS